MMDPLVTRCPTCGTSFKLTGIQLEAAGGAVRCGACLEVFTASEYILNPYPDEMWPEDEPISSTPDDDFEELTEAEQAPIGTGHLADNKTSGVDHESDEYLPDEKDPEDLQIGTRMVYQVANEPEVAGTPADSPHKYFTDDYEIETGIEPLDEVARNSLNETVGAESSGIIEISVARRNFPRLILLACVNLLLIAALAGQFLWFNRDSLSVREDLREYYLELCTLAEKAVNCALPDYINLKQISTRRLVVRSHSEINDALIIDAIILNDGIFAQPFPGLELKFTDIEFNTVASRRFESSEYLDGELTGLGYMPGGTEVRLALEIMDPGKDAISYELYAVPASTTGY
jgi:predicted Zn finger-like uncharacterized protein